MTNKLFSSLTASLLITTLGVPLSTSYANSAEPADQAGDANQKSINLEPKTGASLLPAHPSSDAIASVNGPSGEVEKVGEQSSKSSGDADDEAIAKVQSHEIRGRQAATLYVRNIPVLTFLGSTKKSSGDVKVGTQEITAGSRNIPSAGAKSLSEVDSSVTGFLPSLLNSSEPLVKPDAYPFKDLNNGDDAPLTQSPVWRAAWIATRINQLYRDGLDATKITVKWDTTIKNSAPGSDRFVIAADKFVIATLDSAIVLPDSTRNLEKDALQATNRLRRLLGDAAPLRSVQGRPAWRDQQISIGPIQFRITGFASWYGPGLHGNPTASGERFNQHAMTAAHRTLPFGTRVLVTNLDNGQSTVVRINDRGPFHGNRIIDLSAAAARVLGLVQSGAARVRLEVIDPRSASTVGN